MKKAYQSPELEILRFEQEDVISYSIIVDDPNTDNVGDNTRDGFFGAE